MSKKLTKTVALEGIPTDLWDQLRRKAHAEIPRRTIKNVIIDLVRGYLGAPAPAYSPSDPAPSDAAADVPPIAVQSAKASPEDGW